MASILSANSFGKKPVSGGRPPSESSNIVSSMILRIDILWIVFDCIVLFLLFIINR